MTKNRIFMGEVFGLILFMLVITLVRAYGQETIMNQPSADIVNSGHVFVRFDEFYTQSPSYFDENFNLAYGLAPNLEVSLNDTNAFNRSPFSNSIVLGFKFAPIKTKHFEIYIGDQFIQPLTNKNGISHGNISYEAAALTVGKLRFTSGIFQSYNGVSSGNRAGVLEGIEWTMRTFKNGWMLASGIDYASGAGTNGYTSFGLNFMKGNFFISPGYMISNPHNLNGAHQSFLMAGYTF